MYPAPWRVSTEPPAVECGAHGMTTILVLGLLSSAVVSLPAAGTGGAAPLRQAEPTEYTVLLHAHAALTHGWDEVVALQTEAARLGIDAIILNEQLVADWGWAPPVVRRFFTYPRHLPSVSRYGIERYLSEAVQADQQVPGVLLIPGFEVAPYYRWKGLPWLGGLTMLDWQRNLLLLGLDDPVALKELPVLGMPGGGSFLADWLPRLILIAGIGLFIVALLKLRRRVIAVAVGLLIPLLLIAGPPVSGPFDPFVDEGMAPWQALIDTVGVRGGFVLWSQIESVDDHAYGWGRIYTAAHPGVLEETERLAGFGAIYPSTSSADEPGREWDRVLTEYATGARESPTWGWGEAALHYPEQVGSGSDSKGVDEVLSVVRAADLSSPAILDALRHGRGYAVRSTHAAGRLRLDRFEVRSGGSAGNPGDTIAADQQVRISVDWSYTGSERLDIEAFLIRNGSVVAESRGVPGGTLSYEEPFPEDLPGVYYRIELLAPNHQLLANPVFVIQQGREGIR